MLVRLFLWEPKNSPEESSHRLVHLAKRMSEAPPPGRLLAPGSGPMDTQVSSA